MLGRSAPELAYAYGLRNLRRREAAPSPALLHHIFGSLRGTVLHLGALHDFDTRLYSANRMTAVEIKGCTRLPPMMTTSPIAVLQAYGPRLQVPCILSLLEELLKAGRSPTFLALDLRSMEISRILPELSSRGYEHFKVSRQSLFGCTDEVCAGGPLGDEATDWRHGVIWRNASSVASDALAIRLLQGRSLEHFVLHAAMAGPRRRLGLCLTGQLRSRNGVADLQQVLRRFASFDVFAVVPSQDCARACEVLAPLRAEVLCVDSLFMSPEELQWIREGPKADPDVCPGHHCVYVWRDVDTCGRLLHRYMRRFRVSYWRVARMRLDLRIAMFPKDVAVLDEENTIWAYAIPDRQWIAMPDRFAMGPPRLMDAYFTTYRWMLDKRSWQHYDPVVRTACARRGHLQVEPAESGELGEHRLRAFGKLWPCPEHSARGLAYPGPENVLEARMLTFQASANRGVTVRLRSDICFSHLTQIPDSSCKQLPDRHPHGYWTHDWDTSPLKGSMFQAYLQRQAASPGSAKTETRLFLYDGIFAAGLADFFLAEWGAKESRGQSRPPKILILGAGRGALAEQLARWGLPAVAIDGNCMVEFTAEHRGLCADVVHPRGLGAWAEAACLGAESLVPPAPRVDPELKVLGSKETKVWCHWLQGVSKSDWALALNLLPEIPRHLLPRLARTLSLGLEGVILTMPIGRPLQDAKRRDLVRALRHRGYEVDRDASRHLGALGGLLCCPWNANAIVLRRRRKETACSARVIQQLKGSLPCVLHQNYGCVHSGVWVHFGCRGYFTNGGHGSTLCSSPLSEYAECPWQGAKTELPRKQRLRSAHRPAALVARALFRSDMAHADKVANASVSSHWYTRLFGLPLGGLYEAMDPLSFGAGVWPDSVQERLFLVAALRALKLATGPFVGHGLVRASTRIGRSHRALTKALSMLEIKAKLSGPAERQCASLMLECLRVIADLNHAGLHSMSQQGHVDAQTQWTIPKLILTLEKLMEAAPGKKLAWFERLGGTWHLRVDSEDPWGRYVYKFAYQAAH
ncbi:unnamed protein product [Symbiodinium sp. CCMP2456]|nr:unnamed protein product [Symbiodinium sp. CCMP2456]